MSGPSLKKIVSDLPDTTERRGIKPWYEVMKERQPKLYEELVDLVKEWKDGGPARSKFKTACSMHRFLSGRDEHKLDPPIVTCSQETWLRFVRETVD
jgi:hypothetical protein